MPINAIARGASISGKGRTKSVSENNTASSQGKKGTASPKKDEGNDKNKEQNNTDQITINEDNQGKHNCTVCAQIVVDGAIECDKCEKWTHYDCTGMDKKDIDYAQKNKKTKLIYLCPPCFAIRNDSPSKCQDIKHSKLETRVDDMSLKLDLILDTLKKNNINAETKAPVWPRVEETIQSSLEEVLENQKEIDEKKYNVILFGVAEAKPLEGGGENFREDHKTATDVVLHLDDQVTEEDLRPSFCKVTRLGKRKDGPDEKPRPIKIELPDEETKKRTLKNARLLKDYKIQKIGISHDKTKKELAADRVLRAELRKKREEDAEGEYTIYDKKVMKKEEATKIKEHKERLYKERQNRYTQRGDPQGGNGQAQA